MGKFVNITLNRTNEKFNRDITRETKKFDIAVKKTVEATAVNIQRDTITPSAFPYITGFLRGSYRFEHKAQRSESVVFSVADYAANVEYGYGQKPQPFFEPSIEKNEPLFHQAVEKLIEIYK